jgi:hypothetical protein
MHYAVDVTGDDGYPTRSKYRDNYHNDFNDLHLWDRLHAYSLVIAANTSV